MILLHHRTAAQRLSLFEDAVPPGTFLKQLYESNEVDINFCNVGCLQSYGFDHLLTFSNLRQLGLLVEQQGAETLTVMESKVGKLVNDKTAGTPVLISPSDQRQIMKVHFEVESVIIAKI